jgi:DNA-directed RNA polymerase beta subunit
MKTLKCRNENCNNPISGRGNTGLCRSCSKLGKKRKPFSKEWKENLSGACKGKKKPPRTEEHCEKLSKSAINRFKDPKERDKISKSQKIAMNKPEVKEKLSKANIKRFQDPKERQKISKSSIKTWQDLKLREKLSLACKERFKNPEIRKNHSLALGGTGIPLENYDLAFTIRKLPQYIKWRNKIYQRDNFTCQECGQVGHQLEAHHIKKFSIILKEFLNFYSKYNLIKDKEILLKLAINYKPFWNLDNGQTLCKDCHKLTDNYGNIKEEIKNG